LPAGHRQNRRKIHPIKPPGGLDDKAISLEKKKKKRPEGSDNLEKKRRRPIRRCKRGRKPRTIGLGSVTSGVKGGGPLGKKREAGII